MSNIQNKKIAKNTVFLYCRMLLMLGISLYTSRVVLQVLGIDDYGIYNVVSGFVVMFAFINGALTTGTQRHISFELGNKNRDVATIFSACLKTHVFLAIIMLLALESFGLWFLNTQMNFPINRMHAVNVVYQIAVISILIGVIKTPYEASVISYERMDFYAYTGIIEAILKLSMVFALKYILFDKLLIYAIMMLLATCVIFISYIFYVYKEFGEIKIVCVKDKGIYKYIITFSGWTLFGAIASLLETQGLNVIINITWGVALNAAVGVATQVRSALYQFVSGFQKALSPQLVISESSGDETRQIGLIYKSSRFAFFLMLIITIPLCVNLSFVLDLWLDIVPNFTSEICYLMLIISMLECLSYPLYTTIFAVGNIKLYQIIVAFLRICGVIAALFFVKMGTEPYYIYLAPCLSALAILFYRVIFLQKIKRVSIYDYFRVVLFNIIEVVLITVMPIIIYRLLLPDTKTVFQFLIETVLIVGWTCTIVYLIGMKGNERKIILNYIKSIYDSRTTK